MAETAATPKESTRLNPVENLSGWLEAQDAGSAPKTEGEVGKQEAAPAEPSVAEPAPPTQPPVVDWREVVLPDDVDHGFFRGKKVPQVIESYRYAERAMQEAQRHAADLERQLAARDAQAQPRQPQPVAPGIGQTLFENPDVFDQKLQERIRSEAERIADERFQQHWQAKTREQQIADTFDKGGKAYDEARDDLKLDRTVWNNRAPLVLLHLTNPDSPFYGDGHGITRSADMIKTYKELFGEATAPVVVKAQAPEPPTPPGAKKAASVQTRTEEPSPLSKEERDARRVIAGIVGIDPDKFIKRGEKHRG